MRGCAIGVAASLLLWAVVIMTVLMLAQQLR